MWHSCSELEYILPVDIYRMLSRYYSSPPGGLRGITSVSSICNTVGRSVMAALGMEGGERHRLVLHLAQRCEDDLGGLSLPGCREREQGRAILLLLNDPALMHARAHTYTCTHKRMHTCDAYYFPSAQKLTLWPLHLKTTL